ncbi:MAG: DNA-3-methyladenine glycosylase 2 family protein [Spirochaetales bacterium]|nr:DNA-3-methyladenine glycosylase 2 family protein [Spirochaetales bacterium]
MNNTFSRARIEKDSNFDGEFFFAVKTTGIFCRPSCPAPVALEKNVVYFNSLFEALDAGFHPCHRCRPDISLEYHRGHLAGADRIQRGLKLIFEGFLNYHSLEELARELLVSPRHLRTLFNDRLGLPPVKIARYHKALFARKLIIESDMKITQAAMAAGFRSTRQFNETYRSLFGESPSTSRKGTPRRGNIFLLKYSRPFNFQQILEFMRPRAITGVEIITKDEFTRTFRLGVATGYFSVVDNTDLSALELRIVTDDLPCCMEIYYRIRRVFDLDTDYSRINQMFSDDPILSSGMRGGCVPGLPAAFNPFEFAIRAVLGQQVTVKAATTLAGRIAAEAGIQCADGFPEGLAYFFPNPAELLKTDIRALGITGTRQETIRRIAHAVVEDRLRFNSGQSFDEFNDSFSSLKGIGSWTVNYVAMRGLGMIDSFPASDLGIIRILSPPDQKLPEKKILEIAERWRPYRAYAALCLWERFTNGK